MANRAPGLLVSDLGPEGEAEWQRLRRQIEFADGFWLGFIFTLSLPAAVVLRERAAQLARTRVLATRVLTPETPEALRGTLAEVLALDPKEQAVIFVMALRSDPPTKEPPGPWTAAWDDLFLRANERREALRRHLRGGLVFVTVPEIKERVRQAAPDLWSIRSIVLEPPPLPSRRETFEQDELRTLDRKADLEVELPDDPDLILAEARRRADRGGSGRWTGGVSLARAARALHTAGRPAEALDVAREAVAVLREGPTDLRRDLAAALALLAALEEADSDVAAAIAHVTQALEIRRGEADTTILDWLDLLGQLHLASGDLDSARYAFEEMLKLSRSLVETQGPSAWGDLSSSLDRAGSVRLSAGDLRGARAAYEEALALDRRLLEHTGDTPIALHALSVGLERIGDVYGDAGDLPGARAAYEEALALRRRLIERANDTPIALRDLAAILDRVGDVRRDGGDLAGAGAAHEEALGLARSLLGRAGDTPIVLGGLCTSLIKVGDVRRDAGDFAGAGSAYEEALGFTRRLLERGGDTHTALRALAGNLDRIGGVRRGAGDLAGARAAYEEALGLARRLVERGGDSPTALRDLSISP